MERKNSASSNPPAPVSPSDFKYDDMVIYKGKPARVTCPARACDDGGYGVSFVGIVIKGLMGEKRVKYTSLSKVE